MENNIYQFEWNPLELAAGLKGAEVALAGLDKRLSSIAGSMEEAFSVKGLTAYKTAVRRFGKDLAGDLLVLQLNWGRLEGAIVDAAAPLAAQLVPWMNQAVRQATELAATAGSFLGALFAGSEGTEALAAGTENAAQAQEKLTKAVTSSGRAARRSLLSFDQLQRLNAASGSSKTTTTETTDGLAALNPGALSPELQAAADRLRALIEPIKAIDLTPLQISLSHLSAAFSNAASVAATALEGLWYQVLTPFLTWVAELFAPAFTETWAAAMTLAAVVTEPVSAGLQKLLQAMTPVAEYIGSAVIAALGSWQLAFEQLSAVFAIHSPQITGILQNMGTVLQSVWLRIEPLLTLLREHFTQTFAQIGQIVSQVIGGILTALYGVSEYLAGTFTGDWKRSWEGVKTFLTGLINGVISLLNAMLSRLGAALNSVIRAANRLSFSVPDWVPGLGGAVFGVNMAQVSVPQIPYLAKGAVLPANRPFLAMVGDQRHGTNIEAPLATIQEAVRAVTDGQTDAILAGFGSSVAVQKQILEAVLGIRIGDEVIGAAAQRYNSRQAVLTGGML